MLFLKFDNILPVQLRSTLAINSQVNMVVDQGGERVFMMTNAESSTLLDSRELCSFGSGTWCDAQDAIDVMESDSKWISGAVTFSTPVVLEKKRVLGHLANLSCLEKPTALRELLTILEDAGEAGI